MGIYNTFITDEGDIQVKCHNTLGGWMATFYVGQEVPTCKVDEEGNVIKDYGLNHNIFPYTNVMKTLIVIWLVIFLT